jgi:hypothetical protein
MQSTPDLLSLLGGHQNTVPINSNGLGIGSLAQLLAMLRGGQGGGSPADQNLQRQMLIAKSGLPYFVTGTGKVGVGGGATPNQTLPTLTPAGTGYPLF